MSKLNNIPTEQYEDMRTAAEKEAQAILKVRKAVIYEANKAKRKAEDNAKEKLEIERINAEARKAEAELKLKQMEAEEKTQKLKKRKRVGCISVIILIIAYFWISSSIKSCQEEREAEELYTSPSIEEVFEMSDDADDAVAYVQKQIEKIYDDFTSLVADGRGISKDSVDAIGQGRVWSGADALNIGLVDTLGGLYDAINYAAAKVGLSKADYQLSRYPVAKEVSLLKLLSGGSSDDPEETLTTSVETQVSLEDMFPAIARMREISSPTVMVRMESLMEIK